MRSNYTEKAQKALKLAEKTAVRIHSGYVGTEHILAGLLKEGTGVAARVLAERGGRRAASYHDQRTDQSGCSCCYKGQRTIFAKGGDYFTGG